MRRAASALVTVRLDPADLERYSAEATARGMGLSTYLRNRLAEQDPLLAELASIRLTLESLSSAVSSEALASARASGRTGLEPGHHPRDPPALPLQRTAPAHRGRAG